MNDPMNTVAPSSDERTMAMLAHLGAIVFPLLAPLIFWLINKDKPEKAFATDQAKESLNFQITMFIAFFVSGLLTIVLIGFLLLPVIAIVDLVLCIVAGLKANEGIAYRYPFALRLIK